MRFKSIQSALLPAAIAISVAVPGFCQTQPTQRWPGKGDYKSWDKAMKVFEDGNRALSSGHYDEAIAKYKSAVDMYPQDQNFFNNLGVAYFQKGDLRQAQDNYQQATQQDPNAYGSWNNLAETFRLQNKYEEARSAYMKALEHCTKSDDRAKIEANVQTLRRQMESHPAAASSNTTPQPEQPH